ncbi:MAG: flagellar biosynthesis anti-sigma factor FlgM [Acidobacteria bacterium]|nr:flagellar biosynthesis anti-sigma factor FlgM [Acidobacteriota bacterium]
MKINDPLNGLAGVGPTGPDRARQTEAQAPREDSRTGERRTDSDRVHLSILSQTWRTAPEESPERLARVARLREDYEAGRYQPDPLEVSRKILENALLPHGGL